MKTYVSFMIEEKDVDKNLAKISEEEIRSLWEMFFNKMSGEDGLSYKILDLRIED